MIKVSMDTNTSSSVESVNETENSINVDSNPLDLNDPISSEDNICNEINNPSGEASEEISSDAVIYEDSEKFEFGDSASDITPEKSGGVLKKILREGVGEDFPEYGDRVSVHYTGWRLGKESVEFDSSRKREKFEFNLGRGMVIKGWDLGLSTMKRGEIALFICHPKYAYGEMGYPPTIPPHTPLLFEIELFDWKLEDLSPKRDGSILRKVLDKGEGNTFPNDGAKMKVKISKYIYDDVHDEGEKDFILGEGCIDYIPEGLELALYKFHQKERSFIYLKNRYAEEVIKSLDGTTSLDAEIKYEITLQNFEKAKEIWEMNSDEKFEKAKLAKEKGVSFFKLEHYKVALKQFKWIVYCLEKEPGVPAESQEARKSLLLSTYLNIALCHQKLENYIDVIKVCEKALAMDPNNEKALFRNGQAKLKINDCGEALQDFEKLCLLNPDNKAAKNYILMCQEKIKQKKLKDKSTYNKMFELFVKQDEERLKNMKTETGVWEDGKEENLVILNETERLLNASNSALLDANVIEISNTVNDNSPYTFL